jgi:hypothetical protein
MGSRGHSWLPGHPTLLASLTTYEGANVYLHRHFLLGGRLPARPESLTLISRLLYL